MCCIGEWEFEAIIEYVSGEDVEILTAGFSNVSVENTSENASAFLFEQKLPLEPGSKECFGVSYFPMANNIKLQWSNESNKIACRLKIKKYRPVKVCQPQM